MGSVPASDPFFLPLPNENLQAVNDSRQWLCRIREQTGFFKSEIVHEIFNAAAGSAERIDHSKEATDRLLATKEAMQQ